MSGNCFWLNYNDVFRWRMNYLKTSNPSERGCARSVTDDVQTCMSHLSMFSRDGQNQNESTTLDDDDDTVECDQELGDPEFEVSDEWVRHIEERMKMKAEKEAAAARDKKDAESVGKDNAVCPSTREDYEKRMTEMKKLYGSSASMIIGMETAIQLTFNRNVDLYNPPYWPILPFTFKFAK